MKRSHWFEILLIIAVLAIQLYAAFSNGYNFPRNWFIRDDAYYYFKVAENISLGHGSTFDGINPTNGYHPLWMLICIPIFAVARFDLILPLRVLLIVMSLFSLATAILLYRLISSALSPPVGMLAAVYWVFNFYIQDIFYDSGLESGIALFFIVVLIYMLYELERNKSKLSMSWRQIAWFSVIATLTIFSRLDLAFFAIIVGLWIVFRDEPMRYLMPFDILAVITAILVAFLFRLGLPKYYELSGAALTMIFIGLIVKIPTFFFMSLYPRPATWKPLEMLRNIFLAVIISSGVMAILILTGSRLNILPTVPHIILLTDAALTLIALILIRAMAFGLRGTYAGLKSYSPLEYLKKNWQQWLREGSIYYGILGISLSLYMLWNKLAFGTFTPVSGQIKQWWSTFATNIYGSPALFFQTFFAITPNNTFNAWGLALSPIDTWNQFITGFLPPVILQVDGQIRFFGFLALLGAVAYLLLFLVKKQKVRAVLQMGLIPLFVSSWIQIFSYNSTGYVSPQEWYWLAELVFTMTFTALLLDAFLNFFFKKWHPIHFGVWILASLLCIYWAAQYYQNTIAKMTYQPAPANTPYISQIPFLEGHTRPDDLIGISGGGNIAYFIHRRTVINMDGLINSYPYYLAMKNGTGADYLYNEGMRYIFANPEVLKAPPYSGQYGGRLTIVADYSDKDLLKLSAPNP